MSTDALQCPDCGTQLAAPSQPQRARGTWRCPRCECQLSGAWTLRPDSLLALTVTTSVLWLPALILPLMRLENLGLDREVSLLDCVLRLMQGIYLPVGLLLLFTLVLMPLLNLLSVGRLLWAARTDTPAATSLAPFWMKAYRHSREWAMTDIFLLGILIAMTKLGDMATVTPGAGLFCLVVAVLLRLIVETLAQPDQLQRLLEARHGH
ncbi:MULTISPECIES: paraquat-inducible protein A [unclassified Alcanivorax]|jgi:paraquat-inducible protein A|uniref:paraquat-inducible protein A n=1 Tax=Alcanivorax TaxID=59753 RepID=UPI001E55BDFC|nr:MULTISPECIES: paraquat-inducible protein A [unclassified Alcanivorax]